MSIVNSASSSVRAAADDLDATLSRDRGRLLRLRGASRKARDDARARERFEQALAASRAAYAARAGQVPAPTFPEDLPVAREAARIVELIRRHQVVVVAGETGSGKTTQLPKLCLAAGRGVAGMIGCTQPRRIAARAVARRVAEELQTEIGGAVGFQVRFTDNVSERTHVKFMTDGILLAEIASDRWLSAYDTIIVDEAHERSLNIDFLLGFLKTLLARRPDLKLIVTSATIDTARFAKHFDDAPVVDVAGRSYPVEVRWRGPEEAAGEDEDGGTEPRSMAEAIVQAMDEISREDPRGDTLVFLPGEREIREAHQALERRKYRETEVLPLYARLSARDQDRVFNPGPKRRIVLATNVAETSLTVPRIRYVIDPGVARVKRYSPRQKLDRLHIEKISQASANQRAGRCGRIAAGVCYRLYGEADFLSRSAFTDPEILRASLAGVILRMLELRLGRIEDFPFLEAPDPRAVADGWQQLAELGAVDDGRRLTDIGRTMARMPVDPKLARILVAARAHGCLREALVICAFLGIQDPRERPADARQAADQAHAQFNDPRSEFVGVLNLWAAYREAHEELTQSRLRDWCGKRFLGFLRMREWRELHRQLHLLVDELGWSENAEPAKYPELHRALIAGLPTQIGHRADKSLYEGPRGRRYQVFPGSSLASKPPPWMLSAVLLDTQRVWGLMNATIEPDWAIAELDHLLQRRHHDPHWSRAQGRVVGSEQVSLFGLVLAPKRPVHYGSLYPAEAREIFVREALVSGEINARAAFLERNLKTLAMAREEEAKLRRVGLVADEDWQARWYLDRIPAEMNTAAALDAWYKRLDAAQKASLQWSLAELLPGEGSEADRYPKFLALGDVRLALHYVFEPGREDDGVTLDVPLHLLNALDDARLTWLAPGFVPELATALIRGLPKAQRRSFVPAPDFARAFAEAYPQPTADSLQGELARFLARATGAAIAPSDFDLAAVEPHLRMNIRLLDRSGRKKLAESRDLDALRARFAADAERAFAAHAAQGMAKEGLVAFPEQPIPVSIPGDAGVPAFPALVDTGDAAALRVFADRAVAEAAHPGGVRRLLALALDDRIRQARKQLPVSPKTGLLYATIESADQLRADIVEAALSAVLGGDLGGIRDAQAFEARREQAGKALFPEAIRRLELAESILRAVGELRPALEAPLMGWAKGNLDDLRAQLDALVHPGFLRETPAEALTEFPRYLQAMLLRTERAKRDPARDQQRMLEIAPFVEALDAARAAGKAGSADWQGLRWDIEELRVSLFAQELGTRGAVSAKRLARRVEALRAA
ncbi:ATP-dependent RNA helicase HrpA [Coralloluteibacterium stylophorae]|uniref:ATP-dependent RNA helicase HrpA n=1 Tax=Coralloluteibacterium stylophorae TaxID=1776034 RepID=A0A8J8AX74_9GAMM|nr:ATP-dependent RNA helicase HrpA [Coralloluteibacterium stylophorae]MBS7456760.1 ATP-dependent RNA helicase HrpA [Coralloluteibacterium stylophorae]